jgi:hypothetical protein
MTSACDAELDRSPLHPDRQPLRVEMMPSGQFTITRPAGHGGLILDYHDMQALRERLNQLLETTDEQHSTNQA